MIQIKKAKQNKLTTQVTFESRTVDQLRSNIALALLTGAYNPLRQYSSDDNPIDLDVLKTLKEEFSYLIFQVESNMNVNLEEVDTF